MGTVALILLMMHGRLLLLRHLGCRWMREGRGVHLQVSEIDVYCLFSVTQQEASEMEHGCLGLHFLFFILGSV